MNNNNMNNVYIDTVGYATLLDEETMRGLRLINISLSISLISILSRSIKSLLRCIWIVSAAAGRRKEL